MENANTTAVLSKGTVEPHLVTRLTLNPQAAEGSLALRWSPSKPAIALLKLDGAATLLKARRHSLLITVKARCSSARRHYPQNPRSSLLISFARHRLPREINNVTESNTKIEMSKDILDKVEIEETSEDNSKRKRTSEAWNHFKRVKVEDVLADTLVEALMDWNIDCKVSTITIDNCTTNDAMINHLLQKLPTKDMLLDGKNCYDLLFDYQSRCCTLNESSSNIGGLKNSMSSDVHSNVNVDESLDEFEQFVVSKTSSATNLSATSELDMYLDGSLLSRARDFDILNWWKTNGVKFPTL
ncbi:UNVERIFIED_CONTAM: Zinc finger BED domain-containing protein RICESLEEPER 1 [Sesamum calycinum]|uniref:Zinc finger BED domain-containing protein RICESLEEPER 1 n=1 Tax=Sesamum calycinum TaxID=2727403 RepID=A0AAW2LAT7_9LAMI